MKKLMILALFAMTAQFASAQQVVWSLDFASDPGRVNPAATELENPAVGQLYSNWNWDSTTGTFGMSRPGNDGGIASMFYVIPGSSLTPGQGYKVRITWAMASSEWVRLGIDVWDVDYGTNGKISVETLSWWDIWSGDLRDLDKAFTRPNWPSAGVSTSYPSGDYSARELVDSNYSPDGGATKPNQWLAQIDIGNTVSSTPFAYDGSGNIMIRVLTWRGDLAWWTTNIASVELVTSQYVEPPAYTWATYPIDENGHVNTESFMGWIWVGAPDAPSDWVWSYSLGHYVYMPEELVNPNSGGWVYIPIY